MRAWRWSHSKVSWSGRAYGAPRSVEDLQTGVPRHYGRGIPSLAHLAPGPDATRARLTPAYDSVKLPVDAATAGRGQGACDFDGDSIVDLPDLARPPGVVRPGAVERPESASGVRRPLARTVEKQGRLGQTALNRVRRERWPEIDGAFESIGCIVICRRTLYGASVGRSRCPAR